MTKTTINDFVQLCKDFREFSQRVHGWNTELYCDKKVWCYFADQRNHTSVTIDDIEVSFHTQPKITIPINMIGGLAAITKSYRNKLNTLIKDYDALALEKNELDKQARIAALKIPLKELEEN